MGNALLPNIAAELASDVYALAQMKDLKSAISKLNLKWGQQFDFNESSTVRGKTGGPGFIKCRTAFGFIVSGKGSFAGHTFAIFRGTQYLADHLTSLNFTLSRSAYGQPIHDGFAQALRSMRQQLQEAMRGFRGTTVHCIGHSLGGALATICAEWITSTYRIKPYLYTFGSPRVGLMGFADICTKRIGCESMFRVYHQTDLVPCLPIWPFIHVPNRGADYYVPSPGIVPAIKYHEARSYVESATGQTWKSLAALKPPRRTDAAIARWLEDTRPLSMTLTNLEWLNDALLYVLRQCMHGAAQIISQAASSYFTLLDSLAYILNRGLDVSKVVSTWVVHLIRKIMIITGHGDAVEAADLSQTFIRSVLVELQRKANDYAQKALSNALVKGRAI